MISPTPISPSPALTIMMACRMAGNDNSRFEACLKSLANTAHNRSNFEILIKFDDDDSSLPLLLAAVREMSDALAIRYIVTPRAGGYGDLHKAYLDLLRIANSASSLYWVISDDIEMVSQHWDRTFINHRLHYEDGLFALHPIKKLDFATITPYAAIDSPDGYPVWSKRWIGMQGGFGYVFATDGWTSLLHHRLITRYGIDRCVLVEGVDMKRHIAPSDLEGSPRWNGIRRQTHDYMLSAQLESLVDYTAQSFACYLRGSAPKGEYKRPSLLSVLTSRLRRERSAA